MQRQHVREIVQPDAILLFRVAVQDLEDVGKAQLVIVGNLLAMDGCAVITVMVPVVHAVVLHQLVLVAIVQRIQDVLQQLLAVRSITVTHAVVHVGQRQEHAGY